MATLPRLTADLYAEAIANGTLDALAEPVACALLEAAPEVDDDIRAACAIPAVARALDEHIDLACTHGDALMRSAATREHWHTLGLAVLLRSSSDHRLHTIADSRSLARSVADALGLDFGSVRVGAYALHSLSALATGPSDFAKACAVVRLEAAGALPDGVDQYYGMNETGTKRVQLAQQVQLFVSVRTACDVDARQMARELNQWASGGLRQCELGFDMVDGSSLRVSCLPLMAGLPWTLRTAAGYEIQAMLMAELATLWARADAGAQNSRRYCTLVDPGTDGRGDCVALLAWHDARPAKVMGARIAAPSASQLLDAKARIMLEGDGWSRCEVSLTPDGQQVVVEGRLTEVAWDSRFAP